MRNQHRARVKVTREARRGVVAREETKMKTKRMKKPRMWMISSILPFLKMKSSLDCYPLSSQNFVTIRTKLRFYSIHSPNFWKFQSTNNSK